MPREIVIEVEYGTDKQREFPRILDLNEALYRLARDDKWMSFPLDQVDKTTGQRVSVKSARRVRQVSAKIQELIEDHGLASIARLRVVIPQS